MLHGFIGVIGAVGPTRRLLATDQAPRPSRRRMFITDFAGSVYSANLDGSCQKTLLFAQGNLTGIAFAEIQAQPPAQGSGST